MKLSPLQHAEIMRHVSSSVNDCMNGNWQHQLQTEKSGICWEPSRFKTVSMRKKLD